MISIGLPYSRQPRPPILESPPELRVIPPALIGPPASIARRTGAGRASARLCRPANRKSVANPAL